MSTVRGAWARESWMHNAACASPAGLGVDFFATDPATVRAAQAICAGCPVRTTCLAGAVGRGETAGVWGGQSAEQRRPGRRTTARKPAPAASTRPAPPAPDRPVPPARTRRVVPAGPDRPVPPASAPTRPARVSVAPAGGSRLGPVRVDAELVERLRWLARYLGAYVPDAGDPSLAELVADALTGHAQHLLQRWDITPPPWWTPDRAA